MIHRLTAVVIFGMLGPLAGVEAQVAPLVEFSASAQRLRDSVAARLDAAAHSVATLVPGDAVGHESVVRDSIVVAAREQLGVRYRLGAGSPTRGFDCSGLVQFVLGLLRIDMPRTAQAQSLAGRAIPRDTAQLRPGDLLTFGRGARVTHIGIYVGEGRFVHASVTGRRVVESNIVQSGNWYARHWLGARRVVASAE